MERAAFAELPTLFPETMVSIYELWKQGRFEEAKKVQDSIRAIRNLFRLGNPNTIGKAGRQFAWTTGWPLSVGLSGQKIEKIVNEISRVLKENYQNAD